MDSALKYRIVGATVLLSLAVIFIPMILDGSGKESVTTIDMEMPKEPTLVFSDELEESTMPLMPKPDPSANTSASIDAASIQDNIVPEVIVGEDTQSELLSWVVQVGAFGEKQKAVTLQKKLLDAGFDAIVEVGESKGKDYFRVKVGPVLSQDEANNIKQNLAKKLALNSAFVTRYPRTSEH